ncbi:MAG TPA: hypothetical protein VGG74_15955 [Kofleriaceae bacterium]|jgi:hypothetical protein
MTDYAAVRDAIDAKLGDGVGVLAEVAAVQLSNVEHAVWTLDNLLACLFDARLHIWDQSFRTPAYNGARAIDAIAEFARESDPRIADMLRWTTRWVATRGVAMVSLVPELWSPHAAAARRVLDDVAARWPDEVSPLAIEVAAWHGLPASGAPAVGFTERGAACAIQTRASDPLGMFRDVLAALWAAGTPDDALDDFAAEYFAQHAVEIAVASRYVVFDGDGGDELRRAAVQARIRPVHPLARRLGLDRIPFGSLIVVDAIAAIADALDGLNALLVTDVDSMRDALRRDADVVVCDAAVLSSAAEQVAHALCCGVLVIVGGTSPALAALIELAASRGTRVHDLRHA